MCLADTKFLYCFTGKSKRSGGDSLRAAVTEWLRGRKVAQHFRCAYCKQPDHIVIQLFRADEEVVPPSEAVVREALQPIGKRQGCGGWHEGEGDAPGTLGHFGALALEIADVASGSSGPPSPEGSMDRMSPRTPGRQGKGERAPARDADLRSD
jgi:hypothetical protein